MHDDEQSHGFRWPWLAPQVSGYLLAAYRGNILGTLRARWAAVWHRPGPCQGNGGKLVFCGMCCHSSTLRQVSPVGAVQRQWRNAMQQLDKAGTWSRLSCHDSSKSELRKSVWTQGVLPLPIWVWMCLHHVLSNMSFPRPPLIRPAVFACFPWLRL